MNNAMLRNYDPPWYDRLASGVTDFIYGDDANAQDRAWVNTLVGPENPFNLPAQASQGINTAMDGYNRGDYGQMAIGAAQAGLAATPLMGARAMMPSVRNAATARAKHAMFPHEVSAHSGRPQPRLDDFAIMHSASQPAARMQNRMLEPSNNNVPSAVPSYSPAHRFAAPAPQPSGDLMDMFSQNQGSTITTADAYRRYVERTGDNIPHHVFDRMMSNLGIRKAKVGGRVRYIGIE